MFIEAGRFRVRFPPPTPPHLTIPTTLTPYFTRQFVLIGLNSSKLPVVHVL